MVKIYLFCFFLTILVESLIAWLWHVKRKGWLVVFLVNLLTNPLVVYLNWLLRWKVPALPQLFRQLPLEILAILVEAFVYKRFSQDSRFDIRHPFLLSLSANAASWGFGLLLSFLLFM